MKTILNWFQTASLVPHPMTHVLRTVCAPVVLALSLAALQAQPTVTGPTSTNVCPGATAVFNVLASGTPPLSFQWYFNTNTALADATNDVLILANAAPAQAGEYAVVVTDSGGAVTSAPALLGLNTPTMVTLADQLDRCPGDTVTFTANVTGTGPFTYVWRQDNGPAFGETGNILTVTNITAGDAGTYSVEVAGLCNSATNSAVLAMRAAPVITSEPASLACPTNSTAVFSVAASGAGLTYQWRKEGAELSGQTTPTLTLNNVTTNDNGSYDVVLGNCGGSVTSQVATLAVMIPPSIVTQPTQLILRQGMTGTFRVTAAGSEPLSYQWRKGGVIIPDAVTNSLALTNVQATDAANYDVVITNAVGAITSATARLTVLLAPVITGQPQSLVRTNGDPAVFSVTATGTSITYQWRFNGVNMPGQTLSTLTFASVSPTNAGDYYVVVANANGAVTSQVATLTVLVRPTIVTQPASQVATLGTNVTFNIAAIGDVPLTMQWQFNGRDIPGATGTNYTISNVQMADVGTYQVVLNNPYGTVLSAIATLIVQPATALFCDFNTAGQYTNNFQGFTNNGAAGWYYYETNAGGVNNSRCLDLPTGSGSDVTATFTNFGGFNFTNQGSVLGISMLVKVKNQSASSVQRVLQLGFLDKTNTSINANDGMGFMTVRLDSTTQNNIRARTRHQSKLIAGTANIDGTQSAEVYLVAGRWYKLAALFENTKQLGNSYRVTCAVIDYGTNGTTPGPVITVVPPTLVTNADFVADDSLFPAIRANDTTGCDLLDNLAVYTNAIPIMILANPAPQTVLAGQTATFNVGVEAASTQPFVQWYSNNVAIPLATNISYTTPFLTLSANGANYRAVMTNYYSAVTSAVATLTVNPDTAAPALVSAGSMDGAYVGLRFSKTMNGASAGNIFNYSITGGGMVLSAALRPDGTNVLLRLASPIPPGGSFTVTVNNLVDFNGNPLPNGSQASGTASALVSYDLGGPIMPGSVFCGKDGEMDMVAGGADLYGNADSGTASLSPRSGDFDVKAQVGNIVRPPPLTVSEVTAYNGHEYAKAGLMMRESWDANSRVVQVVYLPPFTAQYYPGANRVESSWRSVFNAGQGTTGTAGPGPVFPNAWVRLRRVGDVFTTYYSTNGINWTQQAQVTLANLPPSPLVGLASTVHYNVLGFTAFSQWRNFGDYYVGGVTFAWTANLPASVAPLEGNTQVFTVGLTVSGPAGASSEVQYLWQRSTGGGAFTNIPGVAVTSTSYTTPTLAYWSDNGAQYRCIVSAAGNSVTSAVATVTMADTTPPTISSVTNYPGQTNGVTVIFSEGISAATATNLANYTLTNSLGETVPVVGANPFGNARTLQLTTAVPLTNGTTYSLVINGVQDTRGLALAANSRATVAVTTPSDTVVSCEQYLTMNNYGGNVPAVTNDLRFLMTAYGALRYTNYFGYNTNWASSTDNYVSRAISYFVPPSNGFYRFFTRSDDGSRLFMNTNSVNSTDPAGKVLLAYLAGNSPTFATNTGLSTNIALVGGQKYYVEMWHAEGSGSDGFTMMYREAGVISSPATNEIAGPEALVLPAGPATAAAIAPLDPTVSEGAVLTLSATGIAGAPPYTYQWQRNGVNIPGAYGFTYTTPPLMLADNGAVYSFVVSNLFSRGEITSTIAVVTDTNAPALVSVGVNPVPNGLAVIFSEPVSPATANNINNYQISGGVNVLTASLLGDQRTVLLTTTPQVPGASYTLTVRDVADNSAAANLLAPNPTTANFIAPLAVSNGVVRRQWFTNLATGTSQALSTFTNHAKFVNNRPDSVDFLASFNSPQSAPSLDDFGVRLNGFLIPTLTGWYSFQVISDDSAVLYLSTDDSPGNKSLVIYNAVNLTTAGTNLYYLVAAKPYYVEAIQKDGSGGDRLEVYWKPPSSNSFGIIPTANLAYAVRPEYETAISQQPASVQAYEGQLVTFSVRVASTEPAVEYQWQTNGINIPLATNASYTTPRVRPLDAGTTYRCVVTGRSFNGALLAGAVTNTVVSDEALLTLWPDLAVLGVSNLGKTTNVFIALNRPANGVLALNPNHYQINNGISILETAFGPREDVVILTTTPLSEGTNYTVTIRDLEDQQIPAQALYPNPTVMSFTTWNSGNFFSDFDAGLPADTAVYGTSGAYTNAGGYGTNSGAIILTRNAASLQGTFLISELNPGTPVTHFTATFKVYTGEGGPSEAADGFSFNFANDLPNAGSSTAETGVGTGLSVGFKVYQTDTVYVKWKGVTLATISTFLIYVQGWNTCTINLDRDGTLDVIYNGATIVNNLATGYTPIAGRFGLYARTGGSYANMWIDDLSINTLDDNDRGLVALASQPASLTLDENQVFSMQVVPCGAWPYNVQWYTNGVALPGANSTILTIPATLNLNGAAIQARVDNGFNWVATTNAILTVIADTNPPVLTSFTFGRYTPNIFNLTFSEPLTPASATNLANYQLSGEVTVQSAILTNGTNVLLTTSPLAVASNYTLTLNGLEDRSAAANVIAPDTVVPFITWDLSRGFVALETFTNITGGAITDLTNNSKYTNNLPDLTAYSLIPTYTPNMDYYGVRISGFFTPAVSGNHVFYLQHDDAGQLRLSTNDSPANVVVRINRGCCQQSPFADGASSFTNALVAGQRYYFEALVKENAGGDRAVLGIRVPGDNTATASLPPIPSPFLSTYANPAGISLTLTPPPEAQTNMENDNVTLAVGTATVPTGLPIFYQWQIGDGQGGFTDLAGANGPAYTTPYLSTTNLQYRIVVAVPGATKTATTYITVVPDTFPPTIAGVVGSPGLDRVQVYFSERISLATATNLANYAITNQDGTPLNILSAKLDPSAKRVALTTAAQSPGANYTVTISGIQDVSTYTNTLAAASQAGFTSWVLSKGFLLAETFTNITGSAVSDVLASPKYPDFAETNFYVASAQTVQSSPNLDNFGGRLTGFLVPPVDGNYTFYIRADDGSLLRLSPNEDPAGLAGIATNATANSAFTNGASAPIPLLGGQRYALEALYKEGTSGDFVQVAWQTPLDPNIVIIPPSSLATYANPSGVSFAIAQQPTNTASIELLTPAFSVGLDVQPTNLNGGVYYYQWRRYDAGAGVFTNIPGANSSSYTNSMLVLGDDQAVFSVEVNVPGATALLSDSAVLTVAPDITPPEIVSVGSLNGSKVCVVFSELVDTNIQTGTATDSFNYTVTYAGGDVYANVITLRPDNRSVVLDLQSQISGDFMVQAIGVLDLSSSSQDADPANDHPSDSACFGRVEGPYTPLDIGTNTPIQDPWIAGTVFTPSSNNLEVVASGNDIWNNSGWSGAFDGFFYIFKDVTGDFDVRVRVAHLTLANVWSKAGLMARVTTNTDARFISMVATPTNGTAQFAFQYRDTTAGTPGNVQSGTTVFPTSWVRLQRSNSVFNVYYATNATPAETNWSYANTRDTAGAGGAYPLTVMVGLCTVSHVTNATTIAQYRDLYFVPQPSMVTPPSGATVGVGAAASVTATAAGEGTLAYQWLFNGSPLANETNTTLALASAQKANQGDYQLVVRNSAGAVTSSVATLLVVDLPQITTQPQSLSVLAGANASFNVAVTSTTTPAYQWWFNGAALLDATNNVLDVSNAQLANAGNYFVVVANADGAVTSQVATLTVSVPATITTHPQGATVALGTNVTLTAAAVGTPTPLYQWWFNDAPLPGATEAALTLNNVQLGQSGNYFVTVTNSAGAATSAVAVLTVLLPPGIIAQPQSVVTNVGANVTFTVTAAGGEPLSYQWRLNGANLPGQTSATLALNNVQFAQAGNYTVAISNLVGVAVGGPATLTVNPLEVRASNPRFEGTTFSLSVSTIPGRRYTLLYKNVLTDATWQPVGSAITGTGNPETLSDTAAPPVVRFYRVSLE